MGRLASCSFILVLSLTIGIVNAGGILKRATDDDVFSNVELLTKNIPILGDLIVNLRNLVCRLFDTIQNMTNGLLGQVLKDILPCTATTNGVQCDGLDENGGITNYIVNLLQELFDIPDILQPVVGNVLYSVENIVDHCSAQ